MASKGSKTFKCAICNEFKGSCVVGKDLGKGHWMSGFSGHLCTSCVMACLQNKNLASIPHGTQSPKISIMDLKQKVPELDDLKGPSPVSRKSSASSEENNDPQISIAKDSTKTVSTTVIPQPSQLVQSIS